MRLSSVVALSFLSGALAGPLRRNSTDSTVGSLFLMTNGQDHNGNGIVSVNIAADGSLSYAGVTSANGLGGHGVVLPLDPILTQGSIRVHEDLGLVAVVNAGSNTIQLFGLNSENPGMLTPFGEPFPSLGDFPGAVEFNAEGTLLCAVNNGVNANVVCFKLLDGGRQIIPGTPRRIYTNQPTNPPMGPGDSIGTVRFTLDQQRIITTVKGHFGDLTNTPGYLAVWGIDEQSDDIISEHFDQTFLPVPAGVDFSLTEVPGHFAYVSADFVGVDVFDLSGGTTDIKINTLRIPGGVANCWSAYSSKTNTYFISDIITSNLTEIKVDADLNPVLVKQYYIPNSNVNEAAVVNVAGTQYLYALLTGTTSVGAFRLDGPGDAVLVQTLNFSAPVEASGFQVDPLSLAGLAAFMPRAV